MKTIITFLVSLLFIVSISSAQQVTHSQITSSANPAIEKIHIEASSIELEPNAIISDEQAIQQQNNVFQNKSAITQQHSNASLRLGYYGNESSLSKGQKVGLVLAVSGVVATTIGVVLIKTDTYVSKGGGYGSYDISAQSYAGGMLTVIGIPLMISGGITLLASTIKKSRNSNGYGKSLQLESKGNALGLVYHF